MSHASHVCRVMAAARLSLCTGAALLVCSSVAVSGARQVAEEPSQAAYSVMS